MKLELPDNWKALSGLYEAAGPAPKKISKPQAGKAMGTTDQGPPEKFTPAQLSRIYDMLYAAQEADMKGPEGQPLMNAVWGCLTPDAKMEWNYSKWKYES